MQFQGRILKWTGDAKVTERWPDGADKYFSRYSRDKEAANHHVIARENIAPRGDLRELRLAVAIQAGRAQVVYFDESYAAAAIFSRDDGGIVTRVEAGNDG